MVQLKQKAQNTQKFMTPEECELWFQTLRRVAPEFVDPAITQVDELLRVSEVFAMKWDNYDKPWTYRQIQYGYNKAFKAAGLKYRSTHVCRHTGATRLLDETGDRLVVQQMGNWSSRDIADHYARIMNDRARKAIEKIDKIEKRKHLSIVG